MIFSTERILTRLNRLARVMYVIETGSLITFISYTYLTLIHGLMKENLCSSWSPFTRGRLALCSSRNPKLLDANEWPDDGELHIAIANPTLAPFGKSAKKYLDGLKHETSNWSLVFGQNVQQVNQLVLSGAADIGLTSQSSKRYFDDSVFLTLDIASSADLVQGCAIIDQDNNAKRFAEFLLTGDAQDILKQAGYAKLNE